MVRNPVKVFARIKNEKRCSEKLYHIKRCGSFDKLVFRNNFTEHHCGPYSFKFQEVFDQGSNQENIFDVVAKPVINSVFQGFNGTIFAYGQTGSGKTYTITGCPKTYDNRGIIPRCIQYIFTNLNGAEEKPTVYISYMEIYNETCYDLFSSKRSRTVLCLEELPSVHVFEDKNGNPHLKNLNVLPVTTEEEAMRLLFLGDANRAMAETPLNEYSSRSHCIFTVHLTQRTTSCNLRFSKLNLVDLAGSERVYKSQITGSILTEAKHINLSLHFLQQVILALSESRRCHVPYRNSLMTFILKDSLAGNCLTVMLATLAVSSKNIPESISTCRFAQRVALVETKATINEITDPYQEILLLKNEIRLLQEKLSELSIVSLKKELTEAEKLNCTEKIDEFLDDPNSLSVNVQPDLNQIQYCFQILKHKINDFNTIVSNKDEEENKSKTVDKQYGKYCKIDGTMGDYEKHFPLVKLSTSSEEIRCRSLLQRALQRAGILASTIEECQTNIKYIRKKLNFDFRNIQQKMFLIKELELQQNVYRNSIAQLKEVKSETIHLEGNIEKMKNVAASKHKYYSTGCEDALGFSKQRFCETTPFTESTICYCGYCKIRQFSEMHTECACSSNWSKHHHYEDCTCSQYYIPSANNCFNNITHSNKLSNNFYDHEMYCIPNGTKLQCSDIPTKLEKDNAELCQSKQDIFKSTDTEQFKKFMESIPMSGDENIDAEICDFYRKQFCN